MFIPTLSPSQMKDSAQSAGAECIIDIPEEEEARLSHSSLVARPSAAQTRPSTTLERIWCSMSNSLAGSPRSTHCELDVGQHEAEFNLKAALPRRLKKVSRSRCCRTCCLTTLFLFALIAAFTLGWVSRAEFEEMLELEELSRPVRQRPAAKSSRALSPEQTVKAFEKVLFPTHKVKEMSDKEKEYFKDLASDKESVEKWAEKLLQGLDTTKSGTLNREEVDELLTLICERCALYSKQSYYMQPRGSWRWGPVLSRLPPLVQILWDKGLCLYSREARDKPGKRLDVAKKEINIFDLENLLRNTFIFGMGHLDPDNEKHKNKIFALTHHNFLRPEFIDYERTEPPAEALAEIASKAESTPKAS